MGHHRSKGHSSKPIHTLRKNCITNWVRLFPAHGVRQWAGHSDVETTNRYYLQVSEAEYEMASSMCLSEVVAQLPENGPSPGPTKTPNGSCILETGRFPEQLLTILRRGD